MIISAMLTGRSVEPCAMESLAVSPNCDRALVMDAGEARANRFRGPGRPRPKMRPRRASNARSMSEPPASAQKPGTTCKGKGVVVSEGPQRVAPPSARASVRVGPSSSVDTMQSVVPPPASKMARLRPKGGRLTRWGEASAERTAHSGSSAKDVDAAGMPAGEATKLCADTQRATLSRLRRPLTSVNSCSPHDGLGELVPARGDREDVMHNKWPAASRGLVHARLRKHRGDALERRCERMLNKRDEFGLGWLGAARKCNLCLHHPVSKRIHRPVDPGGAVLVREAELKGLVQRRPSRPA